MTEPSKIIVLSPDELKALIREAVAEALKSERRDSMPKEWMKAAELARAYNLPKTWFEERGRAGDIARTKPGRYVLFKRRDVEEYLERNRKINGAEG